MNDKATATEKKAIKNPEKHIGKRVNPNKYVIPEGYVLCAMTGKFYAERDAEISFAHWAFDSKWLRQRHIYIEDADWLSQDGYDRIMDVLKDEGVYDRYSEIACGFEKGEIGAAA